MEIILVRHGQTSANLKKILQGNYDTTLNDIGINQAKILAEDIKNINFTNIYCSSLKRARETCEILNTNNDIVKYDDRLKERNYGVLEGKVNLNINIKEEFWNLNKKNNKPAHGESLIEFISRVENFMIELEKKHKNDDKILIVSHSGTIIAIQCYLNKLPLDNNFYKYCIENCGILRLNKNI